MNLTLSVKMSSDEIGEPLQRWLLLINFCPWDFYTISPLNYKQSCDLGVIRPVVGGSAWRFRAALRDEGSAITLDLFWVQE